LVFPKPVRFQITPPKEKGPKHDGGAGKEKKRKKKLKPKATKQELVEGDGSIKLNRGGEKTKGTENKRLSHGEGWKEKKERTEKALVIRQKFSRLA